MTKKRLLVLSFPRMESDARIVRQLNALVEDFDVTTCGEGPKPHAGVVEHIELVKGSTFVSRHLQGVLLNLRRYELAYSLIPQVAEARKKLRGRHFDVVLANDLPAAGVAATIVPGDRIHLDLHEYWPGLHDDVERWRKVRRPHYVWMLKKYATRARGHSTVNEAIAERYEQEFGFRSDVVANAAPFRADLRPGAVGGTIRMVHSGGVNPGRRIDVMMRAVAAASIDVSLDLYLVGKGSDTYRQLERLADELGDRVRILPPVSQAELVSTLNAYDVGIHVLAPTCTNNKLALPNKFFDFVQARLAVLTGPTEAMVEILRQRDLGIVSDGFAEEAVTAAIDSLTHEAVRAYKENADAAAKQLGAEQQIPIWRRSIDAIAAGTE